MNEIDPLWYDREERDEPPRLWLYALAGTFCVLASSITFINRIYWAPEKVRRWTVDRVFNRVA